jgi:hypothetical protein
LRESNLPDNHEIAPSRRTLLAMTCGFLSSGSIIVDNSQPSHEI